MGVAVREVQHKAPPPLEERGGAAAIGWGVVGHHRSCGHGSGHVAVVPEETGTMY